MRVVEADGNVLMEHQVEAGDIWRMCQTKDAPVRDWVKLAVTRARATGAPAVFWLDEDRAHDASSHQAKVNAYLAKTTTPTAWTSRSCRRSRPPSSPERQALQGGKDSISVTGNVLRDYLTDLFPILELGTSAKMLSIDAMSKRHAQQHHRVAVALMSEWVHLEDLTQPAHQEVERDGIERGTDQLEHVPCEDEGPQLRPERHRLVERDALGVEVCDGHDGK